MLGSPIQPNAAYDPSHGFTQGHWKQILAYCQARNIVLIFRTGKSSAIPWIEQGFPAKPMTFKAKVHKELGLLTADDEKTRQQVGETGHWVLRGGKLLNAAGKKPLHSADDEFAAYDPKFPTKVQATFRRRQHPWVNENVVVHRDEKLPFTSDYDLAAILPQGGAFTHLPTQMAVAGAAADPAALTSPRRSGASLFDKGHVEDVMNGLMDGKTGYGNIWVDQVRSGLNEWLKSERIMHGPHIFFVGPGRKTPVQQVELTPPADKGEKPPMLLAFTPGGVVNLHECNDSAEAKWIIERYRGKAG